MTALGPSLQALIQEHILLMSFPVEKYSTAEVAFNPPYITPSLLIQILKLATKQFQEDPIVLNIKTPIYVIGDLHGHLFDLYRIFQKNGLPPESSYLFLGDFVDRGVYSTEVITLVITLKILFPQNIFVIRGNHEFISTKPNNTFRDEINQLYANHHDILTEFYSLFSFLPLAAIVGDFICMHGGIGPQLQTIDQIATLKRPIEFCSDIVEPIVWSDPKPELNMTYFASPRGHGYYFNEDALKTFLTRNNLRGLIRGHLFVDGVSIMFNGACITVFSASNYVPEMENNSGILYIDEENNYIPIEYSPLNTPKRRTAEKVIPALPIYGTPQKNSLLIPKIVKCEKIVKVNNFAVNRPRSMSTVPFDRTRSVPMFLLEK